MILFLSNNEVSRPLYKWLQDQQEEIIWIEEKISIDKIKEMSPSLIINYNYRYIIGEDIIEYMG
ncbi:MAG: formyl transferase, partial [Lachnospiraceae bacterium]|nr:formyl transferase [Lachnospiraceae bacterium]